MNTKKENCTYTWKPRTSTFVACGIVLLVGVALYLAAAAESDPNNRTLAPPEEILATTAVARMAFQNSDQSRKSNASLANAERNFRKLTKSFPGDPAVCNAFGNFLRQKGEARNAIEQFDRAELLDPTSGETAANRAQTLLALGEARAATLAFRDATRRSPSNAAYQFEYGTHCALFRHELVGEVAPDSAGVFAEAMVAYRLATELSPGTPEFWQGYAETFYLLEKPDWKEAQRAWTALLQLDPSAEFVELQLARVALKMRDGAGALEHLTRITSEGFQPVRLKLQSKAEALMNSSLTP